MVRRDSLRWALILASILAGCGGVRYSGDGGLPDEGLVDAGGELGLDGPMPEGPFDARSDGPPSDDLVIGPLPLTETPLAQGTLFVAPEGTGTACASASPCDLWTGVGKAEAGDVVFLRGGTYPLGSELRLDRQGSALSPIVVESHPGELAVIDGAQHQVGDDVGIKLYGSFYVLRRIEIRQMPREGLHIDGTDNLVDGLRVHHCRLSGIHIYSPYEEYPYGKHGSRNTIRNSLVHENSDVGISGGDFANGGNADGIAISSGEANRVEHCLVYGNSDDGIDTWRSTNTHISHSLAYGNGLGDGDGLGIKAGGAAPGQKAVVERCIAFDNAVGGFDYSSGAQVMFRYNIAYDNGSYGFVTGSDTEVARCIAFEPAGQEVAGDGIFSDNSWQRAGTVSFISTDPTSPDFLRPVPGGGFDDIGAYAPAGP